MYISHIHVWLCYIWVKQYNYCFSTRMALAFNNKVDMPLNKEA